MCWLSHWAPMPPIWPQWMPRLCRQLSFSGYPSPPTHIHPTPRATRTYAARGALCIAPHNGLYTQGFKSESHGSRVLTGTHVYIEYIFYTRGRFSRGWSHQDRLNSHGACSIFDHNFGHAYYTSIYQYRSCSIINRKRLMTKPNRSHIGFEGTACPCDRCARVSSAGCP